MTKRIVTMSIEETIHEGIKKLNINLSQTVEDFLGTLINRELSDVGAINIELEKLKKEELEKEISHKASELKSVILNIEKGEEQIRRQKENNLKKEKEELEKNTKCHNCATVHGTDYKAWHKLKVGYICKSCYLSSPHEVIRRWIAGYD